VARNHEKLMPKDLQPPRTIPFKTAVLIVIPLLYPALSAASQYKLVLVLYGGNDEKAYYYKIRPNFMPKQIFLAETHYRAESAH
jgi:hypothetical protein